MFQFNGVGFHLRSCNPVLINEYLNQLLHIKTPNIQQQETTETTRTLRYLASAHQNVACPTNLARKIINSAQFVRAA